MKLYCRVALLVGLNCFNFDVAFSQVGYRATYETSIKHSAITTPRHYSRMIVTDTSYYTLPINLPKADKNSMVYGERIMHHSMYYFSNRNEYYFGNKWRGKTFLSKSFPRFEKDLWVVDTTITHYYHEYRCANAYKVKAAGDTIFVVYTPDVKYPPGLNYYAGLPGLVLESFDTGTNYYEKLITLEKGSFTVRLPSNAIIKIPSNSQQESFQ